MGEGGGRREEEGDCVVYLALVLLLLGGVTHPGELVLGGGEGEGQAGGGDALHAVIAGQEHLWKWRGGVEVRRWREGAEVEGRSGRGGGGAEVGEGYRWSGYGGGAEVEVGEGREGMEEGVDLNAM